MSIESRVTSALRAVLPVRTQVESAILHDGVLSVRFAGTRLLAAWLEAGTPAAVKQALALAPTVQLVVAPRFTDGALATVRDLGLGWLDELGGAEFAVANVVVSRASQPRPKGRTGGWTPATLGVAEALLTGTKATVKALRERTHASPSTLATALQTLTDAGLLTAAAARGQHAGRVVENRLALLNAYAAAAAEQPARYSLAVGALWRDPVAELVRFGEQLDTADVEWAATSALAAAVQAPYQTQVAPWVVYVRARTVADLLYAANVTGLEPIRGGRLELRAFPSPITRRLVGRAGGIRVAPWPRTYADLRWTGVRGEGAADHLAEVMLQQEDVTTHV